MGKGYGDHPPEKFIKDQGFCQVTIFLFITASIVLASLSSKADDGGDFSFPYFFTGYVLASILLVNLLARCVVVQKVKQTGVSRKNILNILADSRSGRVVWPWSCYIGMAWSLAGAIITGIGGVGCGIEDHPDNNNSTIKNSCYYNIEGEDAGRYKGLAIGLLVLHVVSFIWLIIGSCPVQNVTDEIKVDVAPKPAQKAAPKTPTPQPPPQPAPQASPSILPVPKNTLPLIHVKTFDERERELEFRMKMDELQAKERDLERREKFLADKERRLNEENRIPPPPSYNAVFSSYDNPAYEVVQPEPNKTSALPSINEYR